MHPYPEKLVYIARAQRVAVGICPDGSKEYVEVWRCAVHVRGAAVSFGLLRSGMFLHHPPSLPLVWETISGSGEPISMKPISSVFPANSTL
jgi:hypothetical protein